MVPLALAVTCRVLLNDASHQMNLFPRFGHTASGTLGETRQPMFFISNNNYRREL
jgi:hypothetical protein